MMKIKVNQTLSNIAILTRKPNISRCIQFFLNKKINHDNKIYSKSNNVNWVHIEHTHLMVLAATSRRVHELGIHCISSHYHLQELNVRTPTHPIHTPLRTHRARQTQKRPLEFSVSLTYTGTTRQRKNAH